MRLFIVNGATRGLGYALVRTLLERNEPNIWCVARNASSRARLNDVESRVKIFVSDFSEPLGAEKRASDMFSQIKHGTYSEIYYLNNLSILGRVGLIGDIGLEGINRAINVNMTTNLIYVDQFLRHVKQDRSSVLLLSISSGIARNPMPGLFLYGIAKVYDDYLSRVINLENQGQNRRIRAVSFYPGGLATEMQTQLRNDLTQSSLNDFDYSNIFHQTLEHPDAIAAEIYKAFVETKKFWNDEVVSLKRIRENGK